MLISDDFNFWLKDIGYYPETKTPNLDKLARKGILFADAHAASPVCNPSRNALMSGYRPATTGISGNQDGYVRTIPGFENIVTLNQYFTQNGYYTLAGGKIYHSGSMGNIETDPTHWSELYKGRSGASGGPFYKYELPNPESVNEKLFKWGAGDYDLSTAEDTKLATFFADRISNYHTSAQSNQPFFFACGVFRPHLPWNAPKQFYDLFDPEKLPIPKGYKEGDLSDIPGASPSGDFTKITTDGKWKEAIRAYLANMAYADYNVGLVLDAIEKSPQRDNTIIVFFGDHGWHLGEKDRFSKHALYEMAGWTTLIIYDPSAPANGKICQKVVSLQDIYPTLVELAGLPIKDNIEGRSLVPLLRNPEQPAWNSPILMTFGGTHIIKTDQWRLVDNGAKSQLYHMETDPYEWTNLFGKKEYQSVIQMLKTKKDSIIAVGTQLKTNNFQAAPNNLPTVTMAAPANTTNKNIALTATASDADGLVTWVEFFNGNQYLGSDHTAPYTFSWANVPAGTYTLTARATDNKGAFQNSVPVTITIGSGKK